MTWVDVKDKFVLLPQTAKDGVQYAKTRLLPAQAFFIFNLVMISGLGGTLCLLRFQTDIHSAVQVTFSSVLFVTLSWILSLIFYAGLLISSAARTETQTINTIFLVAAFLEIFGFALLTHHTFTVVPRSAIIEEHNRIHGIIQSDHKDLPRKVNDFITLVDEVNKGNFIMLFYDMKETPGFVWDENKMRDQLKAQTCTYFSDPDRYGSIDHFVHIFTSGKVRKYSFLISRKDCS